MSNHSKRPDPFTIQIASSVPPLTGPTVSQQIDQSLTTRTAPTPGFEAGVLDMLTGLQAYAAGYLAAHNAPIGHDAFVGTAWKQIAEGLLAIAMDGDTGRLFGPEIANEIRTALRRHGVEVETDDDTER